MEAILLAGGKAERLGDAAEGRPKALARVAGRPLATYHVARLAAAGVERVIVSCRSGQEQAFVQELDGLGPEILAVGEPEPLGRGGGLRLAAAQLRADPPVFALNADDVLDVDLAAVLARHRERAPAATIVVVPMVSSFGVVDIADDDRVVGFREAPRLPYWVNAGCYVLDGEALRGLPARGDHEQSTFPQLAERGRLLAFPHEGLWLTVNTPKDLRRADEWFRANPEHLPEPAAT